MTTSNSDSLAGFLVRSDPVDTCFLRPAWASTPWPPREEPFSRYMDPRRLSASLGGRCGNVVSEGNGDGEPVKPLNVSIIPNPAQAPITISIPF